MRLKTHPSPHPFVRRHLIADEPRGVATGDVVTLVSPEDVILGDALWNERSDIAARRLTDGDVRFDDAMLEELLERAVALREGLPGVTDAGEAWRVVHAEGDGLSGLVVDRYGDVLVAELYSAGWVPRAGAIVDFLSQRLGTRHARVSLGVRVAQLEGVPAFEQSSPECPRRVVVREHGVRFGIDLAVGHKTGFFCDQRDNRQQLGLRAGPGEVLDVCCNTGGFALAAAAEGRVGKITGVDLDEKTIAVAKANANLNQRRISFVHADAFDWMRQVGGAGRRFATLVVDPPKFIPTRRDVKTGEGKYHDLNRLAFGVAGPGALMLTCSCSGLLSRDSFFGLIQTAARKAGRRVAVLGWTGAAADHPVLLECPETEYLKGLWLRVW